MTDICECLSVRNCTGSNAMDIYNQSLRDIAPWHMATQLSGIIIALSSIFVNGLLVAICMALFRQLEWRHYVFVVSISTENAIMSTLLLWCYGYDFASSHQKYYPGVFNIILMPDSPDSIATAAVNTVFWKAVIDYSVILYMQWSAISNPIRYIQMGFISYFRIFLTDILLMLAFTVVGVVTLKLCMPPCYSPPGVICTAMYSYWQPYCATRIVEFLIFLSFALGSYLAVMSKIHRKASPLQRLSSTANDEQRTRFRAIQTSKRLSLNIGIYSGCLLIRCINWIVISIYHTEMGDQFGDWIYSDRKDWSRHCMNNTDLNCGDLETKEGIRAHFTRKTAPISFVETIVYIRLVLEPLSYFFVNEKIRNRTKFLWLKVKKKLLEYKNALKFYVHISKPS